MEWGSATSRDERAGITRRTIVRAAWAAPVVAAVAVAPLAAASGDEPTAALTVTNVTSGSFSVTGAVQDAAGVGIQVSYLLQASNSGVGEWSTIATGTTDESGGMYADLGFTTNNRLRLVFDVGGVTYVSPWCGVPSVGPPSVSLNLLRAAPALLVATSHVTNWNGAALSDVPLVFEAHTPSTSDWTSVASGTTDGSGNVTAQITSSLSAYDTMRATATVDGTPYRSGAITIP